MKALLLTTIGPVYTESWEHEIQIYTPEESYPEGFITFWDYERGEIIIQPGLRDLVQMVQEELTLYFEGFRVLEISEAEATLEEVMK
jgi:hypothetical protein